MNRRRRKAGGAHCLKVTFFACLIAALSGILIISDKLFNFPLRYLAFQNNYYCQMKDSEFAGRETMFQVLFGEGDQQMPVVVYNGTDPNPPDFYARRNQEVNKLAKTIEENYFKQISKLLTKNSKNESFTANFFALRCNPSEVCGGMGDRLRGLTSVFYMALGLGHVFRIEWTRTSTLSDYYNINEDFYPELDPNTYYEQLYKTWAPPRTPLKLNYMNHGHEPEFEEWASKRDLTCSPYHFYESVRTNSMGGLEGALKNPKFKTNFDKILSEHLPQKTGKKFDASILVSAFLRIAFRNPKDALLTTFNECVVNNSGGSDYWSRAYKVGVQIRQGDPPRFMITNKQLSCFASFVKHIAKSDVELKKRRPLIIFLTVDSDELLFKMRKEIEKSLENLISDFKIVSSRDGETCSKMLNFTHSDVSAATDQSWYAEAKAYVDWFSLRQMDRLVISRSGFAEMASLFSLVPTQRFAHWQSQQSCVFHQFNQIGSFLRFELYDDGQD